MKKRPDCMSITTFPSEFAAEEHPGGESVRMARCGLVGRSDKNWATIARL